MLQITAVCAGNSASAEENPSPLKFWVSAGTGLQYLMGDYIAESTALNENTGGGIYSPRITAPLFLSLSGGYQILNHSSLVLNIETFKMNSKATFFGPTSGELSSAERQFLLQLRYEFHFRDEPEPLWNPLVWLGGGLTFASAGYSIVGTGTYDGVADTSGKGSNFGFGFGNEFQLDSQWSVVSMLSFQRIAVSEYLVGQSTSASFTPALVIHNPNPIDILSIDLNLRWAF